MHFKHISIFKHAKLAEGKESYLLHSRDLRPPHAPHTARFPRLLKTTLRNRGRCGCGFGLGKSPRASREAALPNPEPPPPPTGASRGSPLRPQVPAPGHEEPAGGSAPRGRPAPSGVRRAKGATYGAGPRLLAAAGRAALEVRAQRRGSLSGESRLAPPGRETPAMPSLPTRAGPPHPSPPRRPPSRPSLLLSPSAGCVVGFPPLPRAAPWRLREAGVPRGAFPFFLSGL